MFQEMMEGSGVEDTVVISGWKDSNPSGKKEFDFLIVSLSMKAIVHIEVKRTLNQKAKETVIKQLEDGHSAIKNKVPFQAKSKWEYIQFIFHSQRDSGDEEVDKFLQSSSQMHLSSPSTILADFWNGLTSKRLAETRRKPEDSETYLNILKFYFHQMFIQEDVLTQGKPTLTLATNFMDLKCLSLIMFIQLLILNCFRIRFQ